MGFPQIRMRRLRRNATIRNMVAETRLSADDLILPLFVCHGDHVRRQVSSMPEVYQLSIDLTVKICGLAVDAGVSAVLLFRHPG